MWRLIMKAAISSQGILRTLLGVAALLTLILLGVGQEDFTRFMGTGFGRAAILLTLIFLLVWSVGEAARDALNEHIEKSEKDYYATSKQARKERAYRIIHRLLKEGEFIKNTDPHRRQKWDKWDKEVIQAIVDYCGQEALWFYLLRTQRHSDNGSSMPINKQEYDNAISTLDMFIRDDFRGHLD
jgi:hypothetical protein